MFSAELVQHPGLRIGILIDATDVETLRDRSNKKRSSEEKKLLRVVELARQAGHGTPALFGVPDADLLFALPREAVEEYRGGPFPEWADLVAESRAEFRR